MSIYARLALALAVLGALAALWWRYEVQLQRADAAGYARAQAEALARTLEATREARATESRRNLNTQEAMNASIARERAARADADAARTELGGLRDDLAASTSAAGGESPAACAARAAALTDVFGQCAGRYSSLAEKADRHAEDANTLMQAWPR